MAGSPVPGFFSRVLWLWVRSSLFVVLPGGLTRVRQKRSLKELFDMTKKLTGRALTRTEAKRDIRQEVLDGVRELKAGRGKRTSVEPGRPSRRRV